MLKYVLCVKMLPLHNPPTETHPHPPNQLFRHFCCLLLIGHGWWAIIKSVCVFMFVCVCVCLFVYALDVYECVVNKNTNQS
jgi:hypothetical protein